MKAGGYFYAAGISFINLWHKIRGGGTEEWFGIQACNSLQGAAAIYVTLGHIHDEVPFSSPLVWILYPSNYALILTNGLFFFISGYGLWESRKSKQNYMSGRSFINRLIRLFIPAYISYAAYYPIRKIVLQEKISLIRHMLLDGLFSWFYYNGAVWFIIVLFFLYGIFWVVYRADRPVIGHMILLSCMIVWTAVAVYTGRGVVWYASTFCFALGIFVSQYQKKILKMIDSYYGQAVLAGMALFVISFAVYRNVRDDLSTGSAVFGNLSALSFTVLCYLLLYRYTVGNEMTRQLGKISYEIYLMNTMVIKVVAGWNMSDTCKIYSIVLITILLAALVHLVDSGMILWIRKYLE